jgi:uncharacterized CHY-type Zn-finger protein
MIDPKYSIWDETEDETEDEIIIADECVCSECLQTFELEQGTDVDRCPLCGVPFDGRGN